MADLIAQGRQPEHRWRRRLESGARQTIGRQALGWSTPWDDRISRQHVEVAYRDGKLWVTRLETARNPVFFQGHRADHFALRPGEHFVIGETTFSLADERVDVSLDLPRPNHQQTFTIDDLHRQPFRQPDKRIDALSRLPEIIGAATTDPELFVHLVNLLLSGVEHATAAAVVAVSSKFKVQSSKSDVSSSTLNVDPGTLDSKDQTAQVVVLHWDRRGLAERAFQPSERLIRQAVTSGESVVHVWSGVDQPRAAGQFTLSEGIDWALCTPVQGASCDGWALYVTGKFDAERRSRPHDPEELRDDVKFTELTAATLAGLRQSRQLAARQATLSQFFSPLVLDAISNEDPEKALVPREADVTVMFCDLQGFTRESERLAGDLFTLLDRVSQALGVTTHHILEHGGVIGDFHGDAAMGFWGWPMAQPDAPVRACRAALGIRSAFLEGAAADFRVGIGMASGRAVAGKIGTADQVKVTVFGPVANLAARLESLTRRVHAQILVDPAIAAAIRTNIPPEVCRVRRIARFLPLGLAAPLDVSEVISPTALTAPQLAAYEDALQAFEIGDWQQALAQLQTLPPDDAGRYFLMQFISQNHSTPPQSWDGVIRLQGK